MSNLPTGEELQDTSQDRQEATSNLQDTSQAPDKSPRITSSKVVKLKDPKRVEQGRKLSAISKASKEKKARERFEAEAAANQAQEMGQQEDSWNIDYGFIVGAVGVAAAVGTLYLTYRQNQPPATNGGADCRPGPQVERVSVPKTQAPKPQGIEMFD